MVAGGREVSGNVTLSGTSDAILPTLSENLKVDWGISTLPDRRPPQEVNKPGLRQLRGGRKVLERRQARARRDELREHGGIC